MRRERMAWEAMAVLLVVLAIYRQFDLADLITGLGREVAVDGRWYGERRPFQTVILAFIVLALGAGATVIIRAVSAVHPQTLIALTACVILVLLLGTNTLSLHWTDSLLHCGYGRANVYNMVEAGSVATILAAALLYRQEVTVVMRR